jgi:hypothetical protein
MNGSKLGVRLALPTAIGSGSLASILTCVFDMRRFQSTLEAIPENAPGGWAPGSARKRARPAIAGVLGRFSIS